MYKRILALVMSFAMLFTAIAFGVCAEETEDARIRTQIKRVYRRVLYTTGRSSLNGFCGLMTSYQLWALGVTPYPLTQDGKNMYDYYKNAELSAAGYDVDVYPAKEYSLEEALNMVTHCGTRNAYNIMVGFQRTNTAAGSIYGHAMVIHAILDGTVYFVEGFHTSLGGPEGSVITCSISQFADFYNEWCVYEGLVVFGNKEYTDFCETYATDMFVEAGGRTSLLSLPSQSGTEECCVLRTTVPGEMLRVTDVYATGEQFYYRVEDGDTVCYIPAGEVTPLQTVSDRVYLFDPALPEQLAPGQDFDLAGTVKSENSILKSLSVTVTDDSGAPAVGTQLAVSGRMADLAQVNGALELAALAQGVYTLTVTAQVENSHVAAGVVESGIHTVELSQSRLTVGQGSAETEDVPAMAEPAKDGWVWENDNWYFYQNGAPRTGWYCYEGVDYYFGEDGAAVTGWHEINGRWRCFTAHGAMRTGWVESEQGMCYMLSNGAPAIGWREIDGDLYFFGGTGLMMTEGTLEREGVTYAFGADGIAVAAE